MSKKEQIYEAALRLFNTYGFDRTPTSQIAREAGVATGTLFHYFPTKEELINNLYLQCKESMINRIFQGIDEEKSYRAKIRRAYENMLRWGVYAREEFLFFQQFSNSPAIQDSTHELAETRFKPVMDLVLQGIEQENLKGIDPHLLLNAVMGMIMSNVLYLMGKPELLEDPDFLETTFAMVWDAIKK